MRMIRTDLAMEAHACWKESAGETSELKGVIARDETLRGFPLTRVEIVDNEGAAALQKPQGTYLTLDVSRCQGPEGLQEAAGAVAELLSECCPVPVLRVGVQDRFGQTGTVDYLRQVYGLQPENIVEKVHTALNMKN